MELSKPNAAASVAAEAAGNEAGEGAAAAAERQSADATKKHIRGSSLLLVGQVVSMFLNFAIQLLMVRYLSKSDYGAFAYALSVVSIGSSVVLFGLDKAVARFVPIYHEHKDYSRMFGVMLMALGSIFLIGLTLVLVVFGFQEVINNEFISDPMALSLLLIVIVLSPIEALNNLFQGTLAVFAKSRAIFVRRHLLGPSLKLGAVLLVILLGKDVYFLAGGYLVGSLLGLAVHLGIVIQVLRGEGLFANFDLKRIQFPFRQIYGFSTPLLTTDVVLILRTTLVAVLLQYFGNTTDVAAFRAVVPVAGLNSLVMQSFKYLYTPLASRLYAHNDQAGINDMYWKTAIWITLLTFPIFVVSFSLAQPLTVLLFGERYADSGIILALLSLGYYFNAALGFNSYTLRVYGKVRFIVAVDILTAALGLGLNLLLIPRYGAMGAAVGTTIGLVAYNLLNQVGLLSGTGIQVFNWRYLRVYLSILVSTVGLLLLQAALNPPLAVSIGAAAVFAAGLIRLNREVLDVAQMFPEILRIPLVKPLMGM